MEPTLDFATLRLCSSFLDLPFKLKESYFEQYTDNLLESLKANYGASEGGLLFFKLNALVLLCLQPDFNERKRIFEIISTYIDDNYFDNINEFLSNLMAIVCSQLSDKDFHKAIDNLMEPLYKMPANTRISAIFYLVALFCLKKRSDDELNRNERILLDSRDLWNIRDTDSFEKIIKESEALKIRKSLESPTVTKIFDRLRNEEFDRMPNFGPLERKTPEQIAEEEWIRQFQESMKK